MAEAMFRDYAYYFGSDDNTVGTISSNSSNNILFFPFQGNLVIVAVVLVVMLLLFLILFIIAYKFKPWRRFLSSYPASRTGTIKVFPPSPPPFFNSYCIPPYLNLYV